LATCAHCKSNLTDLYVNGIPTCLPCVNPPTMAPQLLQGVLELIARNELAEAHSRIAECCGISDANTK
jgi:hypothetical protein